MNNDKKKIRRYCERHMSSDGFIDNESGKWVCWVCFKENPFNYPRGRVITEYKKGNTTLRLVDRSTSIPDGMQEVEKYEGNKRVFHNQHRDLSVATRQYNSMRERLITGRSRNDGREIDIEEQTISLNEPINLRSSNIIIPSTTETEDIDPFNVRDVLPFASNHDRIRIYDQENIDEEYGELLDIHNHELWYRHVEMDGGSMSGNGIIDANIENTFIYNCDLIDSILVDCTLHNCRLVGCHLLDPNLLGDNVTHGCEIT